jgi:NitT/TauT family transport system substrate-binding protein
MKQKSFTKPVSDPMSRRQFLKVAGGLGLSAAGMTVLQACSPQQVAPTAAPTAAPTLAPAPTATAAETLETTTIRIPLGAATAPVSVCIAPEFVAEDLLKAEGFTDVKYVRSAGPTLVIDALASGEGDMCMQFSGPSIIFLDAAKPITMLAGVHVGCFALFGSDKVSGIGDLKGQTIAIAQIGGADHVFLSTILANAGIDPTKDVTFMATPPATIKQSFIDGKINAYMAFPPAVQELRAKKIGHVVVNSMMDAPWSQYFCCMATFNRDFVQTKPVATKRALRALLKATDVTALHPEQAAKLMVDRGYTTNYDYALQAMQDIPYNRWRVYNPEDTIRFYSLLLHGVGMAKNTPDEIIKRGTDWHFLNELKAEMPATPAASGALSLTQARY